MDPRAEATTWELKERLESIEDDAHLLIELMKQQVALTQVLVDLTRTIDRRGRN